MKNNDKKIRKLDKTYYRFDERYYGKARLVHAMVAKIAKRYSLDDLNKILDCHFKSSFSLCETYHSAKKLCYFHKRYFIEKDEVLTDKNGTKFCVTNQIGIGNINPIIKVFRTRFHYKVNRISAMI